METGKKFVYNLDETPLEIKSNTAKGTADKYIWFSGTIAEHIDTDLKDRSEFNLAIVLEDFSAWVSYCNRLGEVFFDPEPHTTEVVWTVFKTSEELVFECNGVFCLRYTYNSSTMDDIRCTAFKQPTIEIYFQDYHGQAAEQYRASGTKIFRA